MVYYCFTHITQIDRDQNVALKNNGIQKWRTGMKGWTISQANEFDQFLALARWF